MKKPETIDDLEKFLGMALNEVKTYGFIEEFYFDSYGTFTICGAGTTKTGSVVFLVSSLPEAIKNPKIFLDESGDGIISNTDSIKWIHFINLKITPTSKNIYFDIEKRFEVLLNA